jgi:hypothetical protein
MRAAVALLAAWGAAGVAAVEPRWFKGNLHTHTLWSDGDDYPEMVADWFKRNGYQFLALSDHNEMQTGTRWHELKTPVVVGGQLQLRGTGPVLENYLKRFGPDWVELKTEAGKPMVRLKPLEEFRVLLEEPGRFLMIPGEEITSNWRKPKTDTTPERVGAVHINATNLREHLGPAEADNAVAIMEAVLEAVAAQRARTGQPMLAHINHPNFRSGLTVEDLMAVKRARFFEVYNGHPAVFNDGDAQRLGMDAMWDALLTWRLAVLGLGVVYGVGVDDSHHYQEEAPARSNPGRGWVMVRATHLTPESIVRAMEAGDFYASSGVTLRDVRRGGDRLEVEIAAEPGVAYTTQFVGTRRGYDAGTTPLPADPKGRVPAHRRYSADVGAVLAEVEGPVASYTLRGDEIYVRARIVSSKPKANASMAGERERAWTQPLVPAAR